MTGKCMRCDTPTGHLLCDSCSAEELAQRDDESADMDEDERFLVYECGWMPGGGCMLAGTELCDWECPRGRS